MSVSRVENSHDHHRALYGAGRVPAMSSMLPRLLLMPKNVIGARESTEKRRIAPLKLVEARQERGDGVALPCMPSV